MQLNKLVIFKKGPDELLRLVYTKCDPVSRYSLLCRLRCRSAFKLLLAAPVIQLRMLLVVAVVLVAVLVIVSVRVSERQNRPSRRY